MCDKKRWTWNQSIVQYFRRAFYRCWWISLNFQKIKILYYFHKCIFTDAEKYIDARDTLRFAENFIQNWNFHEIRSPSHTYPTRDHAIYTPKVWDYARHALARSIVLLPVVFLARQPPWRRRKCTLSFLIEGEVHDVFREVIIMGSACRPVVHDCNFPPVATRLQQMVLDRILHLHNGIVRP